MNKWGPLGVAFVAMWTLMMVSWFPMSSIETKALSQPDHYAAPYIRPMHLKGVIRYVTPDQEKWDGLAHTGFFGGWVAGVSIFILMKWLERREKSKKENSN